jgi:hypothetical protein
MFDLPPMFGSGENLWDEPDVVLTYIITALVNGMGIEIGATLMARGLVISGTLISEETYLDQMSELLVNQVKFTDPDVPEAMRESLKQALNLRTLSEFNIEDYVRAATASMENLESEEGDEDDMDDMDDMDDEEIFDQDDFDMDDMPPTLQYVHMKDPLIVAGDPPINFGEGSDVILRLRLTSIDAWMVGKISPEMPDFLDFDDNGLAH